jgi:serine/threonine protein kinase
MALGGTALFLADLTGPILAERYVLGPVIGEGAGSAIFEAEDLRTQRIVVAKLLHVTNPDAAWARLRREALSARIEHPGISAPFDIGEERGVPFVVSERLRGETLAEAITNAGHLPFDFVVSIFVELASALQSVHDAGIVHRDVKPSNVFLVSREGCRPFARLFDFGCAFEIGAEVPQSFMGTPAYMAPEQARGENIDIRVDIHALGISLFESLAGRRPYAPQSYERLLGTSPRSEVPDVRAIRRDTPPLLADIVAKAMAIAPDRRFASAREMQSALMLLTSSGQHHALVDPRDPDAPRSSAPPPHHDSITRVAAATTTALSAEDVTRKFVRR